MRQLRCLEICSGLLTDQGVAALQVLADTLTRLSVAHNPRVGDGAIATINSMRGLQHLNLSHTGVTAAGVMMLSEALQELACLIVHGLPVRRSVLEVLQLPSLVTVKGGVL